MIVFILLLCSITSFAKLNSDTTDLKYRISLDGNYTTGNTNRMLMVCKTTFEYEYKKILNFSTAESYSYGKSNGILAENDWYLNFSTTYLNKNRPNILIFNSVEGSNLRFIDYRLQIGLGPSINIKNEKLNINTIVLYDNTEFYNNEIYYETMRLSTRIKGIHKLIKKFNIIHETYIQPSVLDISNYRFKTSISVEYPVNKIIGLKVTINESYDSIVYPTKNNNDFNLTFGFVVSRF